MAEVNEADIEPDSGYVGGELFGMAESLEGQGPLFSAHVDDAEVGIGAGILRVEFEDVLECALGQVEMAGAQVGFRGLEQGLGIGRGDGLGGEFRAECE